MSRTCRFLSISSASITAAFLVPILWSIFEGDAGLLSFVASLAVGASLSVLFAFLGIGGSLRGMTIREAILSVGFSWMVTSAIVALPYLFSGATPGYLDALFEGVSGFTTTGATVIPDLGALPRSILFWRSFSQWLGGIGIVVLTLVFFPVSGAGMQLFKAEVSGPVHERLTPRIRETATFLWKTYVTLTVLQICLLMFGGGLDFFDASTLSFSTVATGGFSPYRDSVGHFASGYVKWVTALFLFLAASNLTFYHVLFVRRTIKPLRENPEFRFFVFLLFLFGLLSTAILFAKGYYADLRTSAMEGFFHTVSMLSTCGFFTSDYNLWPSSIRHLMLVLMFVGGCAISTAGGITCIRVVIVLRHIREEFTRILHPRAIIPARFSGQAIDPSVVSSCFAFLIAYMGIFLLGFVALALFGQDLTTAMSSAAATLGNVGPGFGMVGPMESYASQPAGIKIVYMLLMLCGRLEIFPLLVLFTREFRR
ncbi:TrkH family potassium uptake protein [Synergistaceae bacterium OttesenSCG-928-I11]|nr:TrkH family potassium uptake protein [Synergistaceae bacterium OttesenSCG-928-I11]